MNLRARALVISLVICPLLLAAQEKREADRQDKTTTAETVPKAEEPDTSARHTARSMDAKRKKTAKMKRSASAESKTATSAAASADKAEWSPVEGPRTQQSPGDAGKGNAQPIEIEDQPAKPKPQSAMPATAPE
ncbi:MAG: hypothetical protein NVSMB3_07860 [Acidobacteriaceae bacterium]